MPMYSSIKSILVLLFAFAFLTACGGGGGSAAPTSTAPAVTVPGTIAAVTDTGAVAGRAITTLGINTNGVDIASIVLKVAASGRATPSAAAVGDVSLYFESDLEGNIKVREDLEGAVPPGVYNILAEIRNVDDELSTVTFTITITDTTAPVITAPASAFTVNEDAESGDTVGTLTITDESAITAVALTEGGSVSTDFGVDNAGKITVLDTKDLDFETKTSYNLSAVATSAAGTSDAVAVVINVTDIADSAPSITAFTADLSRGAEVGDTVGTITIDDKGSDLVTNGVVLSGQNNANFAVANNGSITVANTANFDTAASFSLTAVATNSVGSSESATVVITMVDEKPSFAITDDAPYIVAIGDSITLGRGGDLTTVEQRDSALLAATAVNDAIIAADSAVDNASASTALAGVASQVDAFNTVNDVTRAINNNGGIDKDLVDAAFTAVIGAKAAADADAADATALISRAKDDMSAVFANKIQDVYGYHRIRRLSYRAEFIRLISENSGMETDFIGNRFTAVDFDGNKLIPEDYENEAFDGWSIRHVNDVNAEEAAIGLGGSPKNDGRTYLETDLDLLSDVDNVTPDIAFIMLGTNDLAFTGGTEGRTDAEIISQAKTGLKGIITTLRAKNDKVLVLLAKIPPFGEEVALSFINQNVTPELVSSFASMIGEIISEDTDAKSLIKAVDMQAALEGTNGYLDPAMDIGDGVHPSAAGDIKIAEEWYNALQEFFPDSDQEFFPDSDDAR